MTLCHRRMRALVLFLTLPLSSHAQLNSLVARVDQPRGPVPAECEQGLSPAPPLRVEVRDIEPPRNEPAEPIAPPSSALRSALQETQIALTRNDRPAFDAALARSKALLLNYPAGAERRTAEDIVRLHETAARLWDAQYQAPFFSGSDPEYALVRDLPGYADAVRRSTLTDDNDRRFYPTAESRDFVAQVAGERLQRLGIHRTTRPVREERVERPRSSPRRSTASSSSKPRRRTPSTTTSTRKPAATTPAPRSPKPTVPPTVTAAPAPAPTPTTSSPVAGDVSAPAPAPAQAPADPPATTTVVTETAIPAVETAPVTTPVTSPTTVIPEVPSPSRGRSLILPIILILVGLGVLVVLFRASK